jgi:hypothetical protein
MKEHGLRCGVRSGSGKPTNGRKIQEITALPMWNSQRLAVKSLQEDNHINAVIHRVCTSLMRTS